MRLIVADMPATVVERLAKGGWRGQIVGSIPDVPAHWRRAQSIEGVMHDVAPTMWISALQERPPVADGHIVLDATSRDYEDLSNAAPCVVPVILHDSVFAVEHGFFLTVGGSSDSVLACAPVLDTLAPAPGGWLYAGGRCAPAFLRALMREAGSSWGALAAYMAATGVPPDINHWLVSQRTMWLRLAELAHIYLQLERDEDFHALEGAKDPLPFAPPGGRVTDSPARKLATVICWMSDTAGHSAIGTGNCDQQVL